jgi:tetratricopeptide (TPR) repeat protein
MKTGTRIMTLGLAIMAAAVMACSSPPKPRTPLVLKPTVSQQIAQVNLQGIQEYQSRRFDQARDHFQQVVGTAPTSAEGHYNLGLTLFALGDSDQAREHFIEAANLAPGDKVIWDSPALRQYGAPDPNTPKKAIDQNYSNQRPSFGGGPRQR